MGIGLINKIKYSKILYNIYFYLGSFSLNILKWVVPTNNRLIVFNSFGGRKFDDSPKAIYEAMTADQRFKDYDLVWAFINPEAYDVPIGRKIKSDTLTYFITLLKARVWISNSALERGLKFKGRKTFYLNTWHGTPIKKMGKDIDVSNKSFVGKNGFEAVDVMLAQGTFDRDIFSRVFEIPSENFAIIGLPRNDELVHNNNVSHIAKIKKKLGIDPSKKVILYAPTFREYIKDSGNNCMMAPPIDFSRWEKAIGTKYTVLFRAHYEVARIMDLPHTPFVKDVSSWPNLNELMLASDLLISDYSSIFFDYSILGRPMLTFAYDYDTYAAKRGMYFDIRKELDTQYLHTEDSLLQLLSSDKEINNGSSIKFQKKYIEEYGAASTKVLDIITTNLL